MNCSFRREAFEKAGGYLTSLKTLQEGGWFDPTGEEVEFSLRVKKITGKRIIFNPKVKVYHKIYQSRFRLKTIAKRSFRMGYLRRMSRKIYPDQKGKSGASSIEIMVVKRIFTRLLPETGKSFFKNPANAFRKLSVIFVGLGFTALGFMIYPFKPAQNLNAGHPPDLFVKSSIEYPTATGQIQPK
jgi:GT2 family glycosyltransferase